VLLPAAALAVDPSAQRCEVPGSVASESAVALESGNRLATAGDAEAALAVYEQSLREARARGDERLAVLAAANAAQAAIDAGRLDVARDRLFGASTRVASLTDTAQRARLRIHVGRSYAALAERLPSERSASLKAAAGSLRAAEQEAAAAGDERLRSYALGYTAELYERQGRLGDAAGLTRRAIYAAERADAPDALYRWQWQLGRLEVAAGRPDTGLTAYRSTVATLRRIRVQTALAPERGGVAFQRSVAPIYTELVDLLLARAAASTDGDEQALLVETRDALEDLKVAELRDYFQDPCLEAQRQAAAESIPNTVVLYPVLLPDRVEMIVSRAGRLERYRLPVDRDTLSEAARTFRENLEQRNTRRYLTQSHALYDWLIRPIEGALGDGEAPTTLVLVPDGALRTIPFAALRDSESRRYLIEMHPLAVIPSLTLTDPRPIETETVRVLAAGISEGVGGFSALPAVGGEVEAVGELYPSETMMNEGFAIERFESELANAPFGIVHIASHGEFGGDPSQSFLLAYDGRMSMDQLSRFIGATRFRAEQPLELLTLSACESAAGDDRAALGLAGVALRAGARSALATLWSVNDQATADFVTAFYGELREPGRSRAEALQHAQIELLKTRHYRHPGYWAPFLLISSWL
jgi:CHAT domain-containing protein